MSTQKTAYVTGGTGLVGSHLVERLRSGGWLVKALVRESSDTSFLETLGVELVRGDITDGAAALRRGMKGATHVFHCAGYVDDWAARDTMVQINVEGLRNVLEAAEGLDLARFVLLSSCVVYGDTNQTDVDESRPFTETGDSYNYAKIASERLLEEFVRRTELPAVILRPPYIYGERDRNFFPRVCSALRDGEWVYLSRGSVPFTLVHVGNVVEACVLAVTHDEAVGEAFIVTDGGSITRRELVDILCEEMGYERPTKSVPRRLAKAFIPVSEGLARLFRAKEPPRLNRFRYKFAATHLTFNISKARRLLGYHPKGPTCELLGRTARRFRESRPDLLKEERERTT